MGASPMGRVIQEHLKKPLANEILFGALVYGGGDPVAPKETPGQRDPVRFTG